MISTHVTSELRVSNEGLQAQAGSYESLAGKLAEDRAPTAAGSSWLSSAAAVNAAHAEIAAAGIRCTSRLQATAAKLAGAADSYSGNEAASTARLGAVKAD